MTPTVRVDEEVYEQLKAHAEPFVDTPNSVLRRLLGLVPAAQLAKQMSLTTSCKTGPWS